MPIFSPVIMYRDGKREEDHLQEKLLALISKVKHSNEIINDARPSTQHP
jgi:hypothetical protein